MERDKFKTPARQTRVFSSSLRSTTSKRDSLAAELERDPQLSTAKRQQRSQAFTSSMAHASLERQLLAAQTAKTELETKLREKDALIERLEGDRRFLAERETAEREEKEQEREEHGEEKRKSDEELRSLRGQLSALREEHADLEDAHQQLRRSTAHTINAQKTEIVTLSRHVALLESDLVEQRRVADERAAALEQLQTEVDDLSFVQERSVHHEAEEENWTVVREELHRQAEYMRTLEAANARMSTELVTLRTTHANVEVLREQKRDLERKVRAVDELREKTAQLEAQLDASRREREQWAEEHAQPATPSKTPVSVTQSLSTLRLTYARLLEEHNSNTAQLRRREVELADAEKREAETRGVLEKTQDEVRTLKANVKRSEHNASLAEREVTFLKAMIASYAAEETSHHGSKLEDTTQEHVHHVESLLEEYKETVRRLTQDLEDLSAGGTIKPGEKQKLQAALEEQQAARAEAEQALKDAEAAAEQYEERIDSLEQKLFELGGEIGAGRHLPPGVRVLSLRDNPAQQWADLRQAAMDRLKGENEALLKRLKELEDSGARAGETEPNEELVPRSSYTVLQEENVEMRTAVAKMEKRLMRLKQIFTGKTEEFRETLSSILGVKLAFYPNGQVRVTSVYDLEAAFVFQKDDKGGEGMKMQLVAKGEGGPEDLDQLMQDWVVREQNIPCFLAHVTLACWEKMREAGEI